MFGLKPNSHAEETLGLRTETSESVVYALLAVAFEQRTANLIAHLEAGFMTPGEVPAIVEEITARLGLDR